MKKIFVSIISIILVLSFCLSFVGCSNKINVNRTIRKLERKGFEVTKLYESENDLGLATANLNVQINYFGGGFTVELVRQVDLAEKNDPEKTCQIFVFKTEEQCKDYYGFVECDREHDMRYKLARKGTVMILTNSEIAINAIDLNFA